MEFCYTVTMKKTTYHHGNLKEEFLRIACDFIAENDVDDLTLKVLSDATGTSRSAIYRHFASKDALMEAVILHGFDEFDAAVSPILKEKERPLVERFYLSGKRYIDFARENPNLYRLLFGRKYAELRERVISIKDEDCSGFGALKLSIEEGQADGLLKKEDSYHRTIVIWSSLHGLASLIIDGFMDVETIADDVYDELFAGLLAGGAADKVKLLSLIPFAKNVLKPGS